MPERSSTSEGPSGPEPATSFRRSAWRRLVVALAGVNMWVIMGGGFALGLIANRVEQLESFAWVFFLAGGLLPVVLQTVSTDDDGYDHDLSNGMRVKFIASMLRWSVTPWGILTQFLQMGGNVVPYVRYRGRVPNRNRHVPATELRLPFDGEWTVVNGGVTQETSHSWGLVAQRYAYDFVSTDDEGNTYEGNGDELTDYYAFGEPVRTPADGTVVETQSKLRDYPNPGSGWTEWRTWQIVGNYVVIEHDDGEYSLLAHLKQDSVTVSPGERVEAGDVVGRCGNSGNTTEPHLHYQLQDHPNFWITAGLVPRFRNVSVGRDDESPDLDPAYRDRDGDGPVFLRAGDEVMDTAASNSTSSAD